MCISTTQKFYNINRVFFLKHKFNITVDLLLKNVIMYTNTRAILWQVIQMNNYSSVKHFSLNRSNYITEIKKLIYCIFCNYVKMSISRRLSFPSCIFFILLYLPPFLWMHLSCSDAEIILPHVQSFKESPFTPWHTEDLSYALFWSSKPRLKEFHRVCIRNVSDCLFALVRVTFRYQYLKS